MFNWYLHPNNTTAITIGLIALFIAAVLFGIALRVYFLGMSFPDPDNDPEDDGYEDADDDEEWDDDDRDEDDDQWVYDDAPFNIFHRTEIQPDYVSPYPPEIAATEMLDVSGWLRGLKTMTDPANLFVFQTRIPVENPDWAVEQMIDVWEWSIPIKEDILGWHEEITGEKVAA